MWPKLQCVEYQHSYVDTFWVALTWKAIFLSSWEDEFFYVNSFKNLCLSVFLPRSPARAIGCLHSLSLLLLVSFFFSHCGPWALSFSHKGHVLYNWSFAADYELLILEVNLPVRKAKFSSKEMPLHDGYYFESILI